MSLRQRFEEVNKELWLILSVFVIAGTLNFLLSSQRMVLGFYTLPTLYSAYFYGKRHAVLTAIASGLIVLVVAYFNPFLLAHTGVAPLRGEKWFDLAVWAGLLVVTAYAMGTLYDNKEARLRELRETYFGILMILRQFISKDRGRRVTERAGRLTHLSPTRPLASQCAARRHLCVARTVGLLEGAIPFPRAQLKGGCPQCVRRPISRHSTYSSAQAQSNTGPRPNENLGSARYRYEGRHPASPQKE